MNKFSAAKSPRRAADDLVVSAVEVTTETTGAARRRRASSFSRTLVSTVVAGTLAVGGIIAFASTSLDGDDELSSEQLSVELAIPEAALLSVEKAFEDRSQAASRNAVRSNLTEAIADEAAKDRDELLNDSVEESQTNEAEGTAAEREDLMAADMVLVTAQEEKLKKEAEEAARRLEEARKAAEAAAAAAAAASEESSSSEDASSSKDASSSAADDASAVSAEDLSAVSSSGGSMPLKSNYRVGSGFGATGSWSRYHTGQDFPAPSGTPIYAVASGIVLSPTAGSWAGTNVVIQHANGGSTLYAHMSKRVASQGQAVKAGDLIGYVGNTGRSFGAHLHLEYYKPGITPGQVYSASDPLSFMRSLGVNI
ncbi:MAG: M23 family metallopeptidase [Arachnia sp.]